MKTLQQLCKPRKGVFASARRDIVLDLSDLIQDRIIAEEFFEENYLTDGMKTHLKEAFRRFEGKSAQGVFKLTQAMSGGKTHNLIILGLLAKNPGISNYRFSALRIGMNALSAFFESRNTEVRQAYEGFETSFIYFRRPIHNPQCCFQYWPAKTDASIEVHVSERETLCRFIRHTAYSIQY